jgi:shikimate dehydrogenase
MALFRMAAGCDNYCVVGNPIGHSKSPLIHRAFAGQTGQRIAYEAVLVPVDGFAAALAEFRSLGGKGLNVTVPFKEEAWTAAQVRSARAESAQAANTLWFDAAGRVCADNTDGVGLLRDLESNHGVQLRGRRILLLGAGGAARGVVGPLLESGPDRVVIANRTPDRALTLAARFAAQGEVEGIDLPSLAGRHFDIIINATAAGLHGDVPTLPDDLLEAGGVCYDMVYSDRPTPFACWGLVHGAAVSVDGLGMLVEQAAESFYLWRGLRPQCGPVIAELRRLAAK